ncbi:MAG: serine hydrolase domain-containing protein [Acetobacteraceae bacterium]
MDPDALANSIITAVTDGLPATAVMAIGVVCPEFPDGKLFVVSGSSPISATYGTLVPNGSTPFEIASVTKTFTPFVYYELHANFDGTFGTTFWEFPLDWQISTMPIIALANFESGFPADNESGEDWPPTCKLQSSIELLGWMGTSDFEKQAISPPLSCYTYSNFAFGLLGLACVGIAESPNVLFDKQLRVWCGLLGMRETGLYPDPQLDPAFDATLPVGHCPDGALQPKGASYAPVAPMLFGGGGMVSTGDDMLRWLLFNMGRLEAPLPIPPLIAIQGTVWSAPRCVNPDQPPVQTLMGWFVSRYGFAGDVPFVWKNGMVPAGFTSYIAFEQWIREPATLSTLPSNVGVFVLSNLVGTDRNSAQDYGHLLLWLLLGSLGDRPVVQTSGPDDGYIPGVDG